MVYASGSLAGAMLECLVHFDLSLGPHDMVYMELVIPATVASECIYEKDLPSNWASYPAPRELVDLGDAWVRSGRTAILTVPSVVVPMDSNVLLNPAHPDFQSITAGRPSPVRFDPRLLR